VCAWCARRRFARSHALEALLMIVLPSLTVPTRTTEARRWPSPNDRLER
jgi:hypothetical protein